MYFPLHLRIFFAKAVPRWVCILPPSPVGCASVGLHPAPLPCWVCLGGSASCPPPLLGVPRWVCILPPSPVGCASVGLHPAPLPCWVCLGGSASCPPPLLGVPPQVYGLSLHHRGFSPSCSRESEPSCRAEY
uniref:Secreted protein n=1 Tax=Knipowitschia caucasica TaxID=637954 RepID=A0AAV2LQQ1_KNICA